MIKSLAQRAYWCDTCHVPLITENCNGCGKKGRDISAATLVPVFRSELNYLRNRIDKEMHPFLRELELWVNPTNYCYYYRGKALFKLSSSSKSTLLEKKMASGKARTKKKILQQIQKSNRENIENLKYEAEGFIRKVVDQYSGRPILVSFSGGKDSTIISHLAMNALGRSDILHIFADTTIELSDTYRYINDYQKAHPLTPFVICSSKLDFFETAKSIGPPSRILRWCCSTHKTNPLAKLIASISPNQGVLSFDGIRKAESSRRSKYPKISTQHKIAQEILARPILDWSDLQVWIYLLYHGLGYNKAYQKGFRRVGCLYCPLNSDWSVNMIKVHYPKQHDRWLAFLENQAKLMKHSNPEAFISNGWRARAGGKGLDYYKTSIESAPCALSDKAVLYQLLSGDVRNVKMFLRPLGLQMHVNSNCFLETFFIHDIETKEVLASVEVGIEDRAVRVNYFKKKNTRLFQQRVEKQLRKLQSCICCGSCAAQCPANALFVSDGYLIDSIKCVSCLACVSHQCTAVKSLHFNGNK